MSLLINPQRIRLSRPLLWGCARGSVWLPLPGANDGVQASSPLHPGMRQAVPPPPEAAERRADSAAGGSVVRLLLEPRNYVA